ncbi:MAG: Gfo/Idh/MocA family oxidoreductase [Lentisphaerae bacterium]|nr:Gfo/Idh/MocA family oxidoreductase [Lentisphaerota bacterium]
MNRNAVGKRIGIGLIGYGPYGQHLARVAQGSTLARIPMIWTRGRETADKIRANGFDATNDVDELIAHPDVEAVIVASPNSMHKEHVLKVCAAGKSLWAEKPLVLALDDYDEILAAVERAGIVTHCNFGLRFRACTRKMIELADAGDFGEPLHLIHRSNRGVGLYSTGTPHKAVLHPELSGGWIMHHMCHQVDFAVRLTRQRVISVYCRTLKSDPASPSEEAIAAILTSEEGAIIELADGLGTQEDRYLSYLGTKALAFQQGDTLNFRGASPANNQGQGGWSTLYTPEAYDDDSMVAFISAVTGIPNPRPYPGAIIPITEGRHVLEVLLAMKESASSGKVVDL